MEPVIIQGGMGVGVSSWRLANAVSRLGQLGVVSGTALDQVLVRRLQDGDAGGHMRRALDRFPFPSMAESIWQRFYIAGGKTPLQSYASLPAHVKDDPRSAQELLVVANFVEIFLAREGHSHPVGINYMEKLQIPHLPSMYGAMLAGVDYILMGAGIPLRIPGVLDRLASNQPATYPLHVTGALESDDITLSFSPCGFFGCQLPPLTRPRFLAIIASNALASTLIKKANGKVDGFVIEGPTAGGHNAPPRGKLQLDEAGEPIYGDRDRVDLAKLRELGLPFWLAGGYGAPEKLREALAAGAAGIQVGTPFALCEESALRTDYKESLLQQVAAGTAKVFTDPVASPTGFPFKVARIEGSASEPEVYERRPRICDLGYLREPFRTEAGTIDYRCAGEPITLFVAKGGHQNDAQGRKCLCNALLANIGHPQVRNGKHEEPGLVTTGDDLKELTRFMSAGRLSYSAADVVEEVLSNCSQSSVSCGSLRTDYC
jgi:nitronate monooxygenase